MKTAHHRQREVARIVEQGQEKASPEGLRYRKKLKARLAVERAALELVIERGYDGVIVEDICARPRYPRKRSFNYFPSKARPSWGMDAFPRRRAFARDTVEHDEARHLDVLGRGEHHCLRRRDDEIEGLRREALRSMPQLFFHGQRDSWPCSVPLPPRCDPIREYPERRMLAAARLRRRRSPVASSIAIGPSAHARSMLHVCGEVAP